MLFGAKNCRAGGGIFEVVGISHGSWRVPPSSIPWIGVSCPTGTLEAPLFMFLSKLSFALLLSCQICLVFGQSPPEMVVINEVHYDPEDSTERIEFIELFNAGSVAVNLSNWSFDEGVDFKVGFPWPVGPGGDGGSMELLNPSLDNELGSSWRTSLPPGALPEATLLPLASTGWSWRGGETEASNSTSAWRSESFVEDGTWNANARAPIGYGSVTGLSLNTTIAGMRNNYGSFFARNTFTVAPGGFVLVVNDRAAFEMRYGPGLPVAGEWEPGQYLSHCGKRLKLSHGSGTAVHDFEYDDEAPWPLAAYGVGMSLVLIDPLLAHGHGQFASWQASSSSSGSPVLAEGVSPFAQWMASNGFVDPLAEWNASGFSNLMAYALGADLTGDSKPLVSLVEFEGERYPVIEFRRRLGASEVRFEAQVSFDLDDWSGATVPHEVIPRGDGTESVFIRPATSISAEPKQFLRIYVSLN